MQAGAHTYRRGENESKDGAGEGPGVGALGEENDLQQQREYQRWERAHFIRKRSPRKCCCYALILIYVLGALFWYVASKFILHPYSFGVTRLRAYCGRWT